MGYFPNGTAGVLYEAEWCSRCVHCDGCAVWLAHFTHNYAECNNENSILHLLIPRSKDGLSNEQCQMFLEDKLTEADRKYLKWAQERPGVIVERV